MAQQTKTPSAEQLLRLVNGALRHAPLFSSPVLAPWKDILTAVAARLDEAIAPKTRESGLSAARASARAADAEFDRAHRFLNSLLGSHAFSPDQATRDAAALCSATLYPDKLAVVTASYADEVASGPTFAKRLALPEVQAALAVLADSAASLPQAAEAVVSAAAALGRALDAVDALLADDAGKVGSELFAVRVEAHRQFALFAQLASNTAYPDDSYEHKAARDALVGPYLRYLSSGAGARPTPQTTNAMAEVQAQA